MTTEEVLGYTYDAEKRITDDTMCDRCCHIIALWVDTIKNALGKYVTAAAYERIQRNEADIADMQDMYETGILTGLKSTEKEQDKKNTSEEDAPTQVIE